VHRFTLPFLALLCWTGAARADTIYSGQVGGARIAGGDVAYVVGAHVVVASHGVEGWQERTLGFPSPLELDGFAVSPGGGAFVLGRDLAGRWLALWDGRRLVRFHRDSKQARFGPAGLALDGAGRPVVAYALWFPSHRTFLRLARVRADGTISVQAVTRGGFPSTPGYAAAAPVVLDTGTVRVVETFLPGAIDWGLTGWGRLLFSSALGVPVGSVLAAAVGPTLYAAWTEAFPTLGPPAVVLATHGHVVQSGVAIEDAVVADLVVTRGGPELAANRCIPAAAFGGEGNGICVGLVNGSGVDGLVAGYAAVGDERQLLLQTGDGLEWFDAPHGLTVSVTLNADLSGRVDGANGGTVELYRERPGEARALVDTEPVAPDGSFVLHDATVSPQAAAHRAVYLDAATGIPYAAFAAPPVS
jgi:hypothetical protein